MFVPKKLFHLPKQRRHYNTLPTLPNDNVQQKLYPKPFNFWTYNGDFLNLRGNEKFKSYHIISTENPHKFNDVSDFIEKKIQTHGRINGKKILEDTSLNISSHQQPAKSFLFTSGIYNNGEKYHDAIIIHSKDKNNEEFEWFVTSMSNYFYHDLLLTA